MFIDPKLSNCCISIYGRCMSTEKTPTDAEGLLSFTGMGGAPSPWSKMPAHREEKGW